MKDVQQLRMRSPMVGRRAVLGGAVGAASLVGLGPYRSPLAAEPWVHQLGWIKSIQFGGHFMAIEQGYFDKEGIAAEFLAGGPGGAGAESVAAGRVNSSDSDVEGLIRARAASMPVKAFAAIMQRAPGAIMSLAENPISGLEDFPGKTIAMPNGIRPQVDNLLTAAGIDPAEVTYVPVGTDPGMLAAGQVDGYYGWATNQGVMLQVRGVDIEIAYMQDLGVPGYAGVLYATDEELESRRDVVIAWLRAEIQGWQWQLDHPDETAELVVDKYGQRGLDLESQVVESRLMADFVPVGDAAEHGLLWVDPAVFAQGLDFAIAAGAVEDGQFEVSDLVTQDLIAEAHATLS